MFRKFHVNKDERGLLFRKGDFVRVLRPGAHWVIDPLRRASVEKFALDKPFFDHRLAEYIRKAEPKLVAEEFHVVELGATEAGLRYENGVLVEVLAPDTRRLYWKGFVDVRVETVDIAGGAEIDADLARRLLASPRGKALAGAETCSRRSCRSTTWRFSTWTARWSVSWRQGCTPSGSSAARSASSSSTCACRCSKWRARRS
jgi:hypothetical protein